MTKSFPLVSVVMPVYNAQAYLVDAVASIIEQTLADWELVCVDDGSTDATPEILRWMAQRDARIRVVRQENAGIVEALNRGCTLARGPLIARMDADDIALPARLERQVEWFRRYPKCVAAGTGILEIDADGDPLRVTYPPMAEDQIQRSLLSRQTGLYHPTVMMRTEAWRAVGGYRRQYQWVEDHDLWLRMAQRGPLMNLPSVLLAYRQHASSVCWRRAEQQRELMDQLLREAYQARGLAFTGQAVSHRPAGRSAAGPGKWARAAARGGFPGTACKHLYRLLCSDADPAYRIRMTAETLLRMAAGVANPRIWLRRPPRIPAFEQWHRQWNDHDRAGEGRGGESHRAAARSMDGGIDGGSRAA
ncbi:MAG: glycosyltransferase [Planctomycetota bacterium]|nr:MAG: glycosyltransferase [Planctomycetota bacterium]